MEVVEAAKIAVPAHIAELRIDREFHYGEEHKHMLRGYPKNLGYVIYGYVYNDSATHGNHPFPDGTWIHTSLVKSIEEVEGERYVHTLNSTYKLRD